jgi:hypothetical protein
VRRALCGQRRVLELRQRLHGQAMGLGGVGVGCAQERAIVLAGRLQQAELRARARHVEARLGVRVERVRALEVRERCAPGCLARGLHTLHEGRARERHVIVRMGQRVGLDRRGCRFERRVDRGALVVAGCQAQHARMLGRAHGLDAHRVALAQQLLADGRRQRECLSALKLEHVAWRGTLNAACAQHRHHQPATCSTNHLLDCWERVRRV